MLEVLPKKRFWGHKLGVVDPWNKMIPQEYSNHQNTFCGALSVKPRSMDCSVQPRPKELKKYATWQIHFYAHPIPLKWRVSIFSCEVVCWT